MSTQIILRVLALRHRLRQRDHWTRRQLKEHQRRALHRLREHAYARSPFYGRFHKGLADRPLDELPVLTKEMVMEDFDKLVTDPTVRLEDVEAHLATLRGGDELLGGRYRVASTSGSTGRRGLFLWDPGEWATVLTSYNRSFDWAGVGAGLTHRTRMAASARARDPGGDRAACQGEARVAYPPHHRRQGSPHQVLRTRFREVSEESMNPRPYHSLVYGGEDV